MRRNRVLCAVLINFLVTSSAREQWIDPHDMAVKKGHDIALASNSKISLEERQESTNTEENCSCLHCTDTLHVHYKRTLSILLNVLQMDQHKGNQYKGVININIPAEDYNFFNNFIQNPIEDVSQLKRVNAVLENAFSKTMFQRSTDNLTAWYEWFYFTFYNHTTGITILGLIVAWISCKLLKANWTTWRVVKTLILFAWVVDFAFTWIHLIQEEEIEKVADTLRYGSIPPICDPNKMSWWQYARNLLGTNTECKKYHRTMLQNVFWKVSPFTVFAHQFGIVIATPANNIGKAFGALASGMLDQLPFGIKYVIFPVLLLFFVIAVCILLSFLTNTSFQINFLHLINLKIGDKQRHMLGNLFSIPVEMQREAIQSVRFSDRPQVKQVKERDHCSDTQLASRESGARVEDITSQDLKVSELELNQSSDATVSSCKSEASGDRNEINESCVENLKERGDEMEEKRRLCKSEMQMSEDKKKVILY